MFPHLPGSDSVLLMAGIGSVLVLAFGTGVFFTLRKRAIQARSAHELLYRDPALWVRSLEVSPFPHRPIENGTPAPKPKAAAAPVAKKPASANRQHRPST